MSAPRPRSFDALISPESLKQLSPEDRRWLAQNEGFAKHVLNLGLEGQNPPEPSPSETAAQQSPKTP
jgi:hypothetical protein